MVTRGDIAGALKVLNATNTPDRKGALRAMLTKEHAPKDVEKALSDLGTYPAWGERMDLEPAAPAELGPAKRARAAKK